MDYDFSKVLKTATYYIVAASGTLSFAIGKILNN